MLRVGDFAKIDIAKMRKTMRFGGAMPPSGALVVSNDSAQEDIFYKIRQKQVDSVKKAQDCQPPSSHTLDDNAKD